ncbi:hypothetical protein CO026_01545 [Candidatus Kaiserbacteria bacterium CG_4_9_14_0_2_um_filter_41_32]|uniref:Uncharacterized protein n=1 Tax=Candidatus Kaiserbacteria bacterium CG_4_9_14_0_2_um_filter_41_32 TaxID=1974601 RepID=A0A2M8FEZ9_9BACT|nr:MAG: hypothetical protein CO026_01545 [Candidatus Kaiserbacteria bacterium CG_4_9_14_0_2_um_filter_41_32]
MSEKKEETQKTVIAFIVGLLIGGLLVWAFSGTESVTPKSTTDDKVDTTATTDSGSDNTKTAIIDEKKIVVTPEPTAVLPVGDGSVKVADDQVAGSRVALASATFPIKEGWIGVRDYDNGNLGGLLGVVRFSEEQGLVPTSIILQRATVAGKNYAIVFYTENGDREFSLANDVQVDKIFATFTAK